MTAAPSLIALNSVEQSRGASLNPSVLDPSALPAPSGNSTQDFAQALAAAVKAQSDAGAVAAQGAVAQAGSAAAQERARNALQLNGSVGATSDSSGDAVLNGLQQLRGAFDKQISTFSISSAASGTTEGLYHAQVAAANFSIFMDVSSKLAGKADQAFNSLLKGQ